MIEIHQMNSHECIRLKMLVSPGPTCILTLQSHRQNAAGMATLVWNNKRHNIFCTSCVRTVVRSVCVFLSLSQRHSSMLLSPFSCVRRAAPLCLSLPRAFCVLVSYVSETFSVPPPVWHTEPSAEVTGSALRNIIMRCEHHFSEAGEEWSTCVCENKSLGA